MDVALVAEQKVLELQNGKSKKQFKELKDLLDSTELEV